MSNEYTAFQSLFINWEITNRWNPCVVDAPTSKRLSSAWSLNVNVIVGLLSEELVYAIELDVNTCIDPNPYTSTIVPKKGTFEDGDVIPSTFDDDK